MDKFKRFRSPAAVALLFAIAAALILFGGIGTTIAWNSTPYESDSYAARIQLQEIGVELREGGTAVGKRDYDPESGAFVESGAGTLCQNLLGDDEELKVGKKYDEVLTVYNSGHIDEYVRVTVYKYWAKVGKNGKVTEKCIDLDPSLIEVNFPTGNGWIPDPACADDEERTVLYYSNVLGVGQETSAFVDAITINGDVSKRVEQKITYDGDYKVITNVYEYNDKSFVLEAKVDAVQTHNAHDAILSAWGKDVNVTEDGPITGIN